jgi:hypothetical protein
MGSPPFSGFDIERPQGGVPRGCDLENSNGPPHSLWRAVAVMTHRLWNGDDLD